MGEVWGRYGGDIGEVSFDAIDDGKEESKIAPPYLPISPHISPYLPLSGEQERRHRVTAAAAHDRFAEICGDVGRYRGDMLPLMIGWFAINSVRISSPYPELEP